MKNYKIHWLLLLLLIPVEVLHARVPEKLKVDVQQVDEWNTFTQRLYQLHKLQLDRHKIIKKSFMGGYHQLPGFYREDQYYDARSHALLSRVQWETAQPNRIHMIEVFIYDQKGQLMLDYLSAYLPHARNAPVQTLINIHYKDAQLSAFRQFDASGERIYEQCKGSFFGQDIFLSLDEDEIPFGEPDFKEVLYNDVYPSCFGDLATDAGALKNPLNVMNQKAISKELPANSAAVNEPQTSDALMRLGREAFNQHEFEQAIVYLSKALALDAANDEALFWRGMAYGRNQQVELGVADLTEYISKHPDESRAYTKRGVRYIWMGQLTKARSDLLKAIQLDAGNSEAHDDLGVIYAQEKNYSQAIEHFRDALKYDPSYQKAWHNLSMVHYVSARNEKALEYVDKSLTLKLNKDSLLLKSLIVEAMGDSAEALKIKSMAEKITDNNWSETFAIQ